MPDIIRPATVDPTVVVTITAIADQGGLDPVNLTGAVEVDGAATTPDTVAWRVNDTTAGIADSTDLTTSFTPSTLGRHVVNLSVEIDGSWHYAQTELFFAGSYSPLLQIQDGSLPPSFTLIGPPIAETGTLE